MREEDTDYSTYPSREEPAEPAAGFVGDLTNDEVRLDQLRQAVLERVESLAQIPELLHRLNETDWALWLNDARSHVGVCAGCRRFVRVAETVTLPELVWLGDTPFCHACSERVLAEHTFTCEACSHEFHARITPAPFAICPECDSPGMTLAMSSLWAQLQRARKLNLPATLTPREWLDTLEYFDWRCAYCGRADFAAMDHYIPVVKGGGTTRNNCVPACVSCNSVKGGKHPHGGQLKPAAYARAARYLGQFE
jgi:hypothetical protein